MIRLCKRALLFALVLSLLALTACSDTVKPIKGDKSDLYIVANVFGEPVYLEEVEYLVFNYKLEMEAKYGEGIWDNAEGAEKYGAELREKVEGAISRNPAFISLCRDNGIDVESKDAGKYVEDYIDNFAKEIGGKDEYKEQLAENGLTDHHLRYLISLEYLQESLRQKLCADGVIDDSDETARGVIESDEFIRTLHVYISNDEGDDIEENRKKAKKAVKLLDEGESIVTVIGRYSEDFYMTTTDGYYFTRGEYEKGYEDVAFSLAENEHSGVVEGENGFFVIMRLPKDSKYIEKNFDLLKDRYLFVAFENLIENKAAQAEIAYTEYGRTVDFVSLG